MNNAPNNARDESQILRKRRHNNNNNEGENTNRNYRLNNNYKRLSNILYKKRRSFLQHEYPKRKKRMMLENRIREEELQQREQKIRNREKLERNNYENRLMNLSHNLHNLNTNVTTQSSANKISILNHSTTIQYNEKILNNRAVGDAIPIVILKEPTDEEYKQIFLYESMADINRDLLDECIGIAQDDMNDKYLLYKIRKLSNNLSMNISDNIKNTKNTKNTNDYNNNNPQNNVSLPCPERTFFTTAPNGSIQFESNKNVKVQCNTTKRSKKNNKLTKWSKVLQKYSNPFPEWFATSQMGTIQAMIGPYTINVIDYREKRIILLDDTKHYRPYGQCIPHENIDMQYLLMNDPFYIANVIKHIARSTQETIDVYLENEPKDIIRNKTNFIPHVIQQNLPKTYLRNSNFGNLKTLRVHGSDIRFFNNLLNISLYGQFTIFFYKNENIIKNFNLVKYIVPFKLEIFLLIDKYCKDYKNFLLISTNQVSMMVSIDQCIYNFIIGLEDIETRCQSKKYLSKQLKELQKSDNEAFKRLMHFIFLYYNDFHTKTFYQELINFYTYISKIVNIHDLTKEQIDTLIETANKLYHTDVEYNMLFIDIYTISRILRIFTRKVGKDEKYRMNTSYNSIYFAGSRHTINVNTFFELFKDIDDIYEVNIKKFDSIYKKIHSFHYKKLDWESYDDNDTPLRLLPYAEIMNITLKIIEYYNKYYKGNTSIDIVLFNKIKNIIDILKYPNINQNIIDFYLENYKEIIENINPELNKVIDINYLYVYISYIYEGYKGNIDKNDFLNIIRTEYNKNNILDIRNMLNRYKLFEQRFIHYAPILQKLMIRFLYELTQNIPDMMNDKRKMENDEIIEYLRYFLSNWPIQRCQQLTNHSNIRQPLFVRYDQPYLVGIKIIPKNSANSGLESIYDQNATVVNVNNNEEAAGVGLGRSGGDFHKIWRRMLKFKNS
jgi:hypothetical protein